MPSESYPPSSVLIIEERAITRVGISTLISREPGLEVAGEAQGGKESVELCYRLHPDIALVSAAMSGWDSFDDIRAIKAKCPKTSVLMLVDREDEDLILEAIRAGAAGYVIKNSTPSQLINAVKKTLEGLSPINRELAIRLLRRLSVESSRLEQAEPPTENRVKESPPQLPVSLPPRELEVLAYLAAGKTNRQIAQELHISLSTVKRYIERSIRKLEVSDRTQAAVRATELGLLPAKNVRDHLR